MYGGGYQNYGGGGYERATDNFIQQNIPGGLNSPMGQQLDNMLGGNPNPTMGQNYGGYNNYGGGHHHHHHRHPPSSGRQGGW